MTIIELINDAEGKLSAAGIGTGRLDAEVILAHAMGVERIDLYLKRREEVTAAVQTKFDGYLKRRLAREPVAYIRGFKEFYSIPIHVTKDVLIPRPETEFLVERVLGICTDPSTQVDILDICTGSGCVAAVLATHLPKARIVATDISEEAIQIAAQNLSFAGDRVQLFTGDLFDALTNGRADGRTGGPQFDLITANPPYATTSEITGLAPEINYEPKSAIEGGWDGLDFALRIIEDAGGYLKQGGWLVMEMGMGQVESLSEGARRCGCYGAPVITRDFAGTERVISLQMSNG